MRAGVALIIVVSGCIESPTVELVDRPDGGASSTSTTPTAPSSAETPAPDASTPACDAARCIAAGGACTNDVCSFTCTHEAKCEETVRCPSGMPCSVSCLGKDACTRRVECREATRCAITCDGENACKEGVTCEGPECAITCNDEGCVEDKTKRCATVCTVNGQAAICP
jgi:hypothetical protein